MSQWTLPVLYSSSRARVLTHSLQNMAQTINWVNKTFSEPSKTSELEWSRRKTWMSTFNSGLIFRRHPKMKLIQAQEVSLTLSEISKSHKKCWTSPSLMQNCLCNTPTLTTTKILSMRWWRTWCFYSVSPRNLLWKSSTCSDWLTSLTCQMDSISIMWVRQISKTR